MALNGEQIRTLIQADGLDENKRQARVGWKYYEAEHDIKDYRLVYFDAEGILKEDKYRSNVKISHPFFTELVDQEAQYMLSGEDNPIRSDIEGVQEHLDKIFSDDFWAAISEVLTGTIAKGSEYLFAYMDEDGEIAWNCADGLNVIEVSAKESPDGEDHIIYFSKDKRGTETVTTIQDWTADGVTYWVKSDKLNSKLELDSEKVENPRPHILVDDKGKMKGAAFGVIPFFRLDNNRTRTSGLKPIKGLIDDYDLMSCGFTNNIQDSTEVLYVVHGFQGDNLDELQQKIKMRKLVGTAPDGGVEIKTISVPYEARRTKMEITERNIYRFGMGFNSTLIGDGNVTNVVIKSRYTLLDLKCNKLEKRLKAFLRNIVRFALEQYNTDNGTGISYKDVYFVFDREVMTNAQENAAIELSEAQRKQTEINTLLSLMNTMPTMTIAQGICEVLEIDFEEIKDMIPDDWEGLYEQATAGDAQAADQEGAGISPQAAAEL